MREVQALLGAPDAAWIGTTEAKQLLGVKSEHTVRAWAKAGLLRSRTTPSGRVQVSLEDVLRRDREAQALTTPWDAPMSDAEMQTTARSRPGSVPWQRQTQQQA